MSSFVKHPQCEHECCQEYYDGDEKCTEQCIWLGIYPEDTPLPIFEQRETDQEARLDRRARARECK